jgi:OmpA-OmpF porin, OOP family
MSKFLSLWHVLLAAWIALGVYLWRANLCDCWDTPATAAAVTKGAWKITDNDGFKVTTDQHFRFLTSGASYLEPVSANLQSGIDKTVAFLKANPKKALTITGFYTGDEQNNTVLPNLGLGRANDIKAYLASLGVSSHQLLIDGKLMDGKAFFQGDTLVNGADFSFGTVATSDTRLEQIKARLLGKPLTLHFGTNEQSLTLTEQQRTDLADMIYYLDNADGSSLDIAGHTDDMGKKSVNEYLSLKRAEFVAEYLTQNGNIGADRMTKEGLGPNKPAVPNTSKENRAMNRRVEIILN